MDLKEKCFELRKTVLEMCIKAGTGHVTSCFSCVEIMVALFYHVMNPEDVFLLSKGQASPLLYAILSDKGLIDEGELWKFASKDGRLGVHLDHHIPGAIITAGSLGHGLGIGIGMALSDKTRNIYVLMGDGECCEGSVWEAAMFAGYHKISNLIVIVDCNGYMVTSNTQMVNEIENPLWARWKKFGWRGGHVSGSDLEELCHIRLDGNYPTVYTPQTVKGKGIPFMEGNTGWHGLAPQGEDAERARKELEDNKPQS